MDAGRIRALEPLLRAYLNRFADCFPRRDTRVHFPRYVQGQLSDLERKSVEPMALKMGVPVRTLQEFLSQHQWDHLKMRDCVQHLVRDEHGGDGAGGETIGIIDETSAVKKGDKTPGVQRQHCGAVGKQENCLVLVNLAYARGDFHCLLDGELFLPESWSQDRAVSRGGHPRRGGVPAQERNRFGAVRSRPGQRAVVRLAHLRRMVRFEAAIPAHLDERGQDFVGEVPKSFRAWIDPPHVTNRPFRRGKHGRGRKTPRLVSGGARLQTVERLAKRHPAIGDQGWQRWRIKDTHKGPVVWEVKQTMIVPKNAEGLPGQTYHLIVARNALHPDEMKYFISNAAPETPLATLLRVAFSRWRIERCYEDQKGEVGLDHYEGRRYVGLKRHLILSCVSYLFLSRVCESLRGKKSGVDGVPSSHRHLGRSPELVA